MNLSTTATLETEGSGHCKEVLNKSQLSAGTKKVTVVER